MRAKGGGNIWSWKWVMTLCFASFYVGTVFTNRMWQARDVLGGAAHLSLQDPKRRLESGEKCVTRSEPANGDHTETLKEASKVHLALKSLDKTIASLERELPVARATQVSKPVGDVGEVRQKAFLVIGINTAFSSKKRRYSLRETWMPQGDKLRQLEAEKGIFIRFVIGHSANPGGILDREIDDEDALHKDFLRLEHVEGYHELSAKTKIYFTTAVAKWDAEFYVKVDDDVHVNLRTLGSTLAQHRSKPRAYIGCMKSGPVLSQASVKYHEPESWKFGDDGNKYFRHATGQIYAISKDLATYISTNEAILHKYANEDVSLGSWLIGLDVEHVDDRTMCCGTPPDCEWKALTGNVCAASFDWKCSGICESALTIKEVHHRCGEVESGVWSYSLKHNYKGTLM